MANAIQVLPFIVYACLCHLGYCEERVIGRPRESYPDPAVDFGACNRNAPSYICDPDHLITALEG
jgi:Modulator of levamisole receptor-1